MKDFEEQLQDAMRAVDAPAGFADRLMARAAQETAAPRVLVMPRRWRVTSSRTWVGGAIAAVLAIGVFAGEQQYQRHQRERVADQQFETATRITDKALEHTREQLARAGVSLE